MFKHISFFLAVACAAAISTSAKADPPKVFQVSEDPTGLAYTPAVHQKGLENRYRLRSFVSSGFIYPEGTLQGDREGVKQNGEPVFADKVIGKWTTRVWYITDGRQASTGLRIASVQVFQFDNGETLVTSGAEFVGRTDTSSHSILVSAGFDVTPDAWLRKNMPVGADPWEMTFEIVESVPDV